MARAAHKRLLKAPRHLFVERNGIRLPRQQEMAVWRQNWDKLRRIHR
jgi:hypothetical protein